MATKRARQEINAETNRTESQSNSEKLVIPVIEEEITVDKRIVESGKVRFSKKISEHEQMIDVPLIREEVRVERVPVNLFVEKLPEVRQEGDMLIIPVVEEQVVVQKRLLLIEEIRVRKELIEHHAPQTVKVLREEVNIRRIAADENADGSDIEG